MDDFELRDGIDVVFEKPANDLQDYLHLISPEFMTFLTERGWRYLSFGEIHTRYKYRTADTSVRKFDAGFARIERLHELNGVYNSPLNTSMKDILTHPRWDFSPEKYQALQTVLLEMLCWHKLFDAYVIFGGDFHHSQIPTVGPGLDPYYEIIERILHLAHESLIAAAQGKTQIPEGDWLGPRISMAENRQKTLPVRPLSPLIITSVLVAVVTLCTIVTHDATSSRPWVFRADFPTDIRAKLAEYAEKVNDYLSGK